MRYIPVHVWMYVHNELVQEMKRVSTNSSSLETIEKKFIKIKTGKRERETDRWGIKI
jgi:hypothetical protein